MLRFRSYRLKCNALDCQGCEDRALEVVALFLTEETESIDGEKWLFDYSNHIALNFPHSVGNETPH